jgi:hypothetical protein
LRDPGQAIGIVVAIGNCRLASNSHAGSASGTIVGVAHAALRRRFVGQAVQSVIAARDRAGDRIDELGGAVAGIEFPLTTYISDKC